MGGVVRACHHQAMSGPQLRVVGGFGTTEDPSPDALAALVTALKPGSDDGWLVVERLADASGQTFAQVLACNPGEYLVEHRSGTEASHVQTTVVDAGTAAELLVGWASGDPTWDARHTWAPLDV